ncbi:MAG: hypothetical protein ACRD3J_23305, partial [Thermoanaerobaculia bacterium]
TLSEGFQSFIDLGHSFLSREKTTFGNVMNDAAQTFTGKNCSKCVSPQLGVTHRRVSLPAMLVIRIRATLFSD